MSLRYYHPALVLSTTYMLSTTSPRSPRGLPPRHQVHTGFDPNEFFFFHNHKFSWILHIRLLRADEATGEVNLKFAGTSRTSTHQDQKYRYYATGSPSCHIVWQRGPFPRVDPLNLDPILGPQTAEARIAAKHRPRARALVAMSMNP
jgi:hypothetical protein